MHRVTVKYAREKTKGGRYVLSLTISCCPTFSQWGTSTLLHFLFARGVAAVLLVGGQGVADQDRVHHLIPFCVVRPKSKSADENYEHLINLNNKFEIFLPLFVLMSYGRVLSL
jgi:hypothetical protein